MMVAQGAARAVGGHPGTASCRSSATPRSCTEGLRQMLESELADGHFPVCDGRRDRVRRRARAAQADGHGAAVGDGAAPDLLVAPGWA